MLTLAISDVPGDDPATIGSGPTVADPTTLADARAVLEAPAPRWKRSACSFRRPSTRASPIPATRRRSPAIRRSPAPSTASSPRRGVARGGGRAGAGAGYEVIDLGDALKGEARDVAARPRPAGARGQGRGRKVAIMSGGELDVTVRNGNGRGGPNQEYALASPSRWTAPPGISALAADTDGIDGGGGQSTDPAGAMVVAGNARGRAR